MNKINPQLKTHYAEARCNKCDNLMVSDGGGKFSSCSCGASYIDQERFSARYVRVGGDATFIEQICPANCNIEKHKA